MDTKIKFKFIDEEKIEIIMVNGGEEKQVGHIFTPSGSGHDTLNAIQICGFSEAFDLWGCAVFAHNPINEENNDFKKRNGQNVLEQTKDIQLLFNWETNSHVSNNLFSQNTCCKCFNEPCTCEIHIKGENPYTVKRASDLLLLRKERK